MAQPTTSSPLTWDAQERLYYRWDEGWKSEVYVDTQTGRPIRRRSDVEKSASDALSEHIRRRNDSLGAGAARRSRDSVETVAEGFGRMSMASEYSGGNYTTNEPSTSEEPPESSIRTQVIYEPKESITDQILLRQGYKARARISAPPQKRERERLDPNFRRQPNPDKFFVVGRVIKVLWPELGGYHIDNLTVVTAVGNKFKDEKVFLKIRWFVVIVEGAQWCTCLPIATYGNRGVAKPGVLKWQYSVIYTGREEPSPKPSEEPGPGEHGMRLAIRVDPTSRQDSMDPMSRLHYGKLYTIEHNVKVYDFGMVRQEYLRTMWTQWKDVMDWSNQGPASLETPSYQVGSPTTSNYRTSAVPDPVLETQLEPEVAPHFIDYAVVTTKFKPDDSDPVKDQKIAIKKRQRLGIIAKYESGWMKAWNQETTQTGLVWKDFIQLDSLFVDEEDSE